MATSTTTTSTTVFMVRAVAAFQPSPSLLTGEAKSNDCLHSDEALINMLRERGYKGELTKTLTI